MMQTAIARKSAPSLSSKISSAIKHWWESESNDWDDAINDKNLPGGQDLWDSMPTVDSKAIARSSPIFKRHLGIPLDPKLIRHGGYNSIQDAIDDLVPKMCERARLKQTSKKSEST